MPEKKPINSRALWAIIPSAPAYAATPDGRIMRVVPARTRGSVPYEVLGGDRGDGYQRVKIVFADGVKRGVAAHRLICEAFHGRAPSAMHHAAHWDGDKNNNSASNLRWATPKENVGGDRIRHGRAPRGEMNGRAKLTWSQVNEIRATYTGERGQLVRLQREYNIGKTSLRAILNGSHWIEH